MKSTELNSVFTEVIPGFSAKDVLNVVIFDSIWARLGTFFHLNYQVQELSLLLICQNS